MTLAIAWRNLWRQPRRTLVILCAVIVGVWAMVFFPALMRGMMEDMVNTNISNLSGHIQVQGPGFFENPVIENRLKDGAAVVDEVRPLLPPEAKLATRFRTGVVVRSARGAYGATLVGIDPSEEQGVSFIGSAEIDGESLAGHENGVLVGRALLDKLESKIGHRIVVDAQDTTGTVISWAFRVVGVFRTQLEGTEKQFIFCQRETLQRVLSAGHDLTEIAITLPGREQAEAVAGRIEAQLEGREAEVYTWKEMVPFIGAWIDGMEVFTVIWNVVVFIAMAFGLVNTILMAVFERIREFGLVRALGVTPRGVIASVLAETAMLLVIGLCVGSMLAMLTVGLLASHGLDLSVFAEGSEYFGISRIIYPEAIAADYFWAGVVVLGLGLLVSLYPAIKAARVTPVQAMAHI